MPNTHLSSLSWRQGMASSVTDAESLHLRCAEVLWDCLDGLCLHEREAHPTLGKPEELLALMLKKR